MTYEQRRKFRAGVRDAFAQAASRWATLQGIERWSLLNVFRLAEFLPADCRPELEKIKRSPEYREYFANEQPCNLDHISEQIEKAGLTVTDGSEIEF